jgi:hypothetical protein
MLSTIYRIGIGLKQGSARAKRCRVALSAAGVCVHGRHVSRLAPDGGIAETVILTHDSRANSDQHIQRYQSIWCVYAYLSHYTTQHTIAIANSTPVYIPREYPISRRIGHGQRPPVTLPQTELARWPERNNTHKLAYQVVSSRESAQDGLVVTREGLTVRP